jgi:hypothetical protein
MLIYMADQDEPGCLLVEPRCGRPALCDLTRMVDVVTVGTTLTRSWFRGHAMCWGTLSPSLFREAQRTLGSFKGQTAHEFAITQEFKRVAPAYIHDAPAASEDLRWLLFMQHFGTPTRLLDWSTSVLTALYFAVEEPSDDGELWALYPEQLNKVTTGVYGLATEHTSVVRYLAANARMNTPDTLEMFETYNLKTPPRGAVALKPPCIFPRLLAQSSMFTIHAEPKSNQSIPELLMSPLHLCRYRIPADAKQNLRWDLAALGVTRKTLFPDLEGLSGTIIEEQNVVTYNPPKPPSFQP